MGEKKEENSKRAEIDPADLYLDHVSPEIEAKLAAAERRIIAATGTDETPVDDEALLRVLEIDKAIQLLIAEEESASERPGYINSAELKRILEDSSIDPARRSETVEAFLAQTRREITERGLDEESIPDPIRKALGL